MKIKFMLIALILALPACSTLSVNQTAGPDEQLKAENRLMKNKLDLALRENKVLKEENFQYKTETALLKKEISRMLGEIASLKKKYDEDMAGMTERFNDMSDRYVFLEESSGKKIQELIDLNRKLEKQMKDEIARLNASAVDQKAAFEKTRLALEEDFSTRLLLMEAALKEKEASIASMEALYEDALLQLENLRKEVESCKAATNAVDEKSASPVNSTSE